MLKHIDQFFANKSKAFIFGVGGLLVFLAGVLDYVTGLDFQVDIFYLVPIFIVTWFGNQKTGLATAAFTTVLWTIVNKAAGRHESDWTLILWNAVVEFGFFFAIVSLFSAVRRQTRQLEELATQDALTGIANRRSFSQAALLELHRCKRYGSPFTVAYLDLDNFKEVNDTQGHNAGDELLRQVARAMQTHLRDLDLAARLGGDEFAILFPGADARSSMLVVNRIQALLLEEMARRGWPVTFSIGVVTFSEAPESLEAMIACVDDAMYSVKKNGKNRTAFALWPPSEPDGPQKAPP